jgi:hypothetical protein
VAGAGTVYVEAKATVCTSQATHLRQAPHLLERLLVPDNFLAININNILLICLMLLIKL